MRFSEDAVLRIRPPAGAKDYWKPDDALPGFGIRFRSGGAGIYGIRYSLHNKDRRLAFEQVGRVTLADARTWARKQFLDVANGTDPAVSRARESSKASGYVERHIAAYLGYLKDAGRSESYIHENTRSLQVYFKTLHGQAPADITRAAVATELAIIRKDRGPIAGDRARSHLCSYFGWLMREGLLEHNVVLATNRIGAKARERFLFADELRAVWHALGTGHYADIMRLLILTGQRKTQISALRWEEINFADAQLELPAGRMKGRRAHIVALAPMALEILKQRTPRAGSPYAFGRDSGPFVGWAKSKSDLDKKIGDEVQENWTVHDLRRTWSTHASERLAIPQHIVNAVLGHKLGGVRGVYNRSQYLSERRAALEAYAIYIAKIVGSDQR